MSNLSDRRRTLRIKVNAIAELTAGGLTRAARVADVSPGGVRLEVGPRQIDPGAKIYVRLPRYGLRQAKVVWSAEGHIGIQFVEPLGLMKVAEREMREGPRAAAR
jgi:hypothetical protein